MKYTRSIMGIICLLVVHATIAVSGGLQLHSAALFGNARRVKKLLGEGADPNARDANGKTALHCAVGWGGTPKVVQLLLRAGADVDAKDVGGKRPLHEAATWGNIDLVRALLDAGATVDQEVLDNARSNEMYRLLLEYYKEQHSEEIN